MGFLFSRKNPGRAASMSILDHDDAYCKAGCPLR